MPKARILAVDDQLYFRVFLEDLLPGGYEVTHRRAGGEGAAAARRGDFDDVLIRPRDGRAWTARRSSRA